MIKNNFCILVHYRNPFIVNAGTEKYIKTQIQVLNDKSLDSIVLFPVTKKIGIRIYGWGVVTNGIFDGVWSERKVITYLNKSLENYSCQGVFIHHLKWSNLDSLARILSFTKRIIYYVHDYYSCCAQGNFLKNDEALCCELKISDSCYDCKYYQDSIALVLDIKTFFSKFCEVIVISPSNIARDIWLKTFEECKMSTEVIEHLRIIAIPQKKYLTDSGTNKLNVAFLGQGAHNKGWEEWKKAVIGLDKGVADKYNFYHFGTVDEKIPNVTHVDISVSNDGVSTMVKMLKEYNIKVAVLYSIWPETYSYTFFEALEAGCYIVTSTYSGNIARQVNKYKNGIICNDSYDLKAYLTDYKRVCDEVDKYFISRDNTVYNVQHNDKYLSLLEQTSSHTKQNSKFIFGSEISNILYRLRYRKDLGKV